MAPPVTLAGPLVTARLTTTPSDTWYLRARSCSHHRLDQGSVRLSHSFIVVYKTDQQCQFDTIVDFETMMMVQFNHSIKRDALTILRLSSDTQFVSFRREFSRTMANWHGGEFLHKDDYNCPSLSGNLRATAFATDLMCFVLSTCRPPGTSCGESHLQPPPPFFIAAILADSPVFRVTGSPCAGTSMRAMPRSR